MNNQGHDSQSTSGSKFKLNPTANEFVPGSTFPTANAYMYEQPTDRQYAENTNYNNNYNNYRNNKSHHYNNNNSNNNNNKHSGDYYTNNNYNNNSNYKGQGNAQYYNNNFKYTPHVSEFDPVEIEARCEAVVEILQDNNIRDQLNNAPNQGKEEHVVFSNNNNNNNNTNTNQNRQNYNSRSSASRNEEQELDEAEMLEMLEMQEECRLEMMKFYIQSQNPSLFEEIYHDVSYPDNKQKASNNFNAPSSSNASSSSSAANSNETNSPKSSKADNTDSVSEDLVSNKLANLNMNNPNETK